jgi:dephospho-CoA kinase
MMIKLGLTGGIGSGKSTVAKVFEILGVPVFYADDEAKKFLFDEKVKSELLNNYGKNIFDSDNNVIKAELAKIVFADAKQLQKLNSIVHPLLLDEFESWSKRMQNKNHQLVVMEAAILLEAGFYTKVDKILTIITNDDDRIRRVMQRDSVTKQQVEARMKHQWKDEERSKMSDFVIDNSDHKMILKDIIALLGNLKAL